MPVPVSEIIIDYNVLGTPEKLSAELARLNADDDACMYNYLSIHPCIVAHQGLATISLSHA